MLKELKRVKQKVYYKDTQEDIIFSMYNWDNDLTLESVEEFYNNADIDNHSFKTFLQMKENPLAIFQLEELMGKSYLKPMNISLWEYETFIKNEKNSKVALKSAFINQSGNDFYLACESYNGESEINEENVAIIEKEFGRLYNELKEILDTDYIGIEIYG